MKRVKAKWTMKVAPETKLLVRVGDKVVADEVLGEETVEAIQSVDMSAVLSKLSPKSLAELNLKKGEMVNEGDVLALEPGWFGKKILAPVTGKIVDIDEFLNIKFSSGDKKVRKMISPVGGKVIKIEEGLLTIEFNAVEADGEGVNAGKVWGKGLIKVDKMTDVNIDCIGKVILVGVATPALVTKIEAVGGVGIVTRDARINSCLPVLVLEGSEFEKLSSSSVDEWKRVLLNTTGGRLLLVE